MRATAAVVALALAGLAAAAPPDTPESFSESLTLRPLADGRVHAFFAFDIHSDGRAGEGHFRLLPRSLVQIARATEAERISLSLGRAAWDYETWGSPTWWDAESNSTLGEDAVGAGAEILLQVPNTEPATLQSRWKTVTASLAGMFCASLDAADEAVTQRPFFANRTTLRAALPSENICTENLTPLLKMLPCKASAGLAQLLSPQAVLSSDFHSLSMHLSRSSVRLTFQAVFSPMLDRKRNVIDRRDWSLSGLFQRVVDRTCPLATSSQIHVLRPQSTRDEIARLSPRPPSWQAPKELLPDDVPEEDRWARNEDAFASILSRDGKFSYDTSLKPNIGMQWWPLDTPFKFPGLQDRPVPPMLTASRALVGPGQERGEIVVRIRNNDAYNERQVLYTESLPWLLQPALHSLQITAEPHAARGDALGAPVYFRDELETPFLLALAHQPSVPRQRSFLLEAKLRIPRASTLVLRYDVAKAFLRYTEHLPDAHRGFDLPAAVITPADGARIYTAPALLEAAVPDFSMPYNVIIMTSTVIALFFGSVFNNLTRRYQDAPL